MKTSAVDAPRHPDARRRSRHRGCLLGVCIGDAFGAPVEFDNRATILEAHPPLGVTDLLPWGGFPAGAHTDDGQMSVAGARGILDWRRACGWTPAGEVDSTDLEALSLAIHRRYLEWADSGEHIGRSPGMATMSALTARKPGLPSDRVNSDYKGCGGVMRVAPLGLAGLGDAAFEAAARAAILTHGHPTSDACSGFLAVLIGHLVDGLRLPAASARARAFLAAWKSADVAAPEGVAETLDVVDAAIRLAAQAGEPYAALQQIGHVGEETPGGSGKGWVAEEALGIGLFAALRFPRDFAAALGVAANISGDSDSTASVAGAILGATLGVAGIPAAWVEQVENRAVLLDLADELGGSGFGAASRAVPRRAQQLSFLEPEDARLSWAPIPPAELEAACRLYERMTDHTWALDELHTSIGYELDITIPAHRDALLLWLERRRCRIRKIDFPLAKERLDRWYRGVRHRLPDRDLRLIDVDDSVLDEYAAVFDSLLAIMQGPEGADLRVHNFGETAVARALFVVRPHLFLAWDSFLRGALGLRDSGDSYVRFLKAVRRRLRATEPLFKEEGRSLEGLPEKLGRARSTTVVQLALEYYWITLARGISFRDAAQAGQPPTPFVKRPPGIEPDDWQALQRRARHAIRERRQAGRDIPDRDLAWRLGLHDRTKDCLAVLNAVRLDEAAAGGPW